MQTAAPRPHWLAYLALGAGILCLTFSAFFIRWSSAPGVVTTFFRMGLAGTLLAPVMLPRARKVNWSPALLSLALLGGVISALDHATWAGALGVTSVANATLLNNTAPVWVALAAWLFFREKLNRRFWLGLVLTLSGAVVVLGNNVLLNPKVTWGDLLGLLSGLFYAAYYIVTQRARARLDAITYMGIVDVASCLTLLIICLAAGLPLTGFPPLTYGVFLGAAVVSQIMGHVSLSYALGHLPASLVSPTMLAQPVISALLAIPLLGESLQPGQWLGGLAVLAGIYLVNQRRAPDPAP